jgi:DNA polymerase-4
MWLFLDMNSYFATCEQQENPALRGQPVGIAPVMAETTCCIAVSYEAKHAGVKTGTRIADARLLCPNIRIIEARPHIYRAIHNKIKKAVETVVPVHQVLSVDEMTIRPWLNERTLADSLRLGQRIQDTIRAEVGEWMSCSIGIAPNAFLAKVASDLHKPRGLSVITKEDLPHKVAKLALRDWPGISKGMEARFNAAGVFTTLDMYGKNLHEMRAIFGGINGVYWYRQIHGEDFEAAPTKRSQIGHSSVLSPEFRTRFGAWAVACRQLEKAAERLRAEEFYAGGVSISLSSFKEEGWSRHATCQPTSSTATLLKILKALWQDHVAVPSKVSVVLYDLVRQDDITVDFFDRDPGNELDKAADYINQKYERGTLTTAAALQAKEYLNHQRISFGMPAVDFWGFQ